MKPVPITFIVGSDLFQHRLLTDEIRKAVFPNGSGGLNDDTFDGKGADLSSIFDLANTLPMLSPQRFIFIRNAEATSEKDQTQWLRYLKAPSPSAVLVASAQKLDKRTKFAKTLVEADVVVEAEPPKPRDVPSWIDRLAKRNEISVAPAAKMALAEAVGSDLGRLDQEIGRLALFVHPEKTISEKAVTSTVLQTTGENVFAWTDQIVEGRWKESVSTLHHLIEEGSPELVLVSMLVRHLRILLKAKDAAATSARGGELTSLLGVPPFLVSRYMDQCRRLQRSALLKALDHLATLDRELKSTGLSGSLLLERATRAIANDCAARR